MMSLKKDSDVDNQYKMQLIDLQGNLFETKGTIEAINAAAQPKTIQSIQSKSNIFLI